MANLSPEANNWAEQIDVSNFWLDDISQLLYQTEWWRDTLKNQIDTTNPNSEKLKDSLKDCLPSPIDRSDIVQTYAVQIICKLEWQDITPDGSWWEKTEIAYNSLDFSWKDVVWSGVDKNGNEINLTDLSIDGSGAVTVDTDGDSWGAVSNSRSINISDNWGTFDLESSNLNTNDWGNSEDFTANSNWNTIEVNQDIYASIKNLDGQTTGRNRSITIEEPGNDYIINYSWMSEKVFLNKYWGPVLKVEGVFKWITTDDVENIGKIIPYLDSYIDYVKSYKDYKNKTKDASLSSYIENLVGEFNNSNLDANYILDKIDSMNDEMEKSDISRYDYLEKKLSNLNTTAWLKELIKFAETYDFFDEKYESKKLWLIDKAKEKSDNIDYNYLERNLSRLDSVRWLENLIRMSENSEFFNENYKSKNLLLIDRAREKIKDIESNSEGISDSLNPNDRQLLEDISNISDISTSELIKILFETWWEIQLYPPNWGKLNIDKDTWNWFISWTDINWSGLESISNNIIKIRTEALYISFINTKNHEIKNLIDSIVKENPSEYNKIKDKIEAYISFNDYIKDKWADEIIINTLEKLNEKNKIIDYFNKNPNEILEKEGKLYVQVDIPQWVEAWSNKRVAIENALKEIWTHYKEKHSLEKIVLNDNQVYDYDENRWKLILKTNKPNIPK